MPFAGPAIPAGPDAVAVDPPRGVAPRVEARRRGPKRAHHEVGRQRRIETAPKLRPVAGEPPRARREAERHHLARCMSPGIGSPGETDSHPLAGQSVKDLLQRPLHRPSVRLVLGSGESRSVVLDRRPRASLRGGRHRSDCCLDRSDQLDLNDQGRIPEPRTDLRDPGEPGAAIGVLLGDLAHQLVDDERLVRHLADQVPARRKIAALGDGDHPVHDAAHLLGLGLGRLHALVAQDRDSQVVEHPHAVRRNATQLASRDPMWHRGLLLAVQLRGGGLVQLRGAGQIRLVARALDPVGGDEAAQRQPLLHLVEALLAEIAHPQQLVVAQGEELTDLRDVVALQAVVRAHREVELLDRRVEQVRAGADRQLVATGGRATADVGEAAELPHEDVGRLGECRLRRRRPIGLDLEHELVEVRHLADARVLDLEVHAAHRGEDGVDGDDADRHVLGVLGRAIADSRLDGEVHLDRALVRVEGQEDELGVDDLEVRGLGDVARGDGS